MSGSNYSAHAEHPDSGSSAPSLVPPLVQMSVHSLPDPAQDASLRTRSGRWKMLMVWAVCALPVVASYLTYYVIRPQGRANYGTLITPPIAIPADASWSLQDEQGKQVLPSALKGQWLLVSVADGDCDAICEKHLYQQRQLREVLGKDKDRLDRVWLVTGSAPVRSALLPALAQSWVLHAQANAVARWLKPEAGHALGDHLYLVDPRGDWMMRFPAELDPSLAKKDLARLMKANESWDEAGR